MAAYEDAILFKPATSKFPVFTIITSYEVLNCPVRCGQTPKALSIKAWQSLSDTWPFSEPASGNAPHWLRLTFPATARWYLVLTTLLLLSTTPFLLHSLSARLRQRHILSEEPFSLAESKGCAALLRFSRQPNLIRETVTSNASP